MSFERHGWTTFRIGDIAEIFDGPHATPKKTSDGPVFLGISCLTEGRLDLSDAAHLSEEDFEKWTRRVTPQPGDLVFSYETRLGEAALIPEGLRCCLGRRMGLLRVDSDQIDPEFLLYAWLGPEFQSVIAQRTIHGSTVNRIALTELGSFPIRVPDLDEQHRIAGVLGALEGAAEHAIRTSTRLEALVSALFEHAVATQTDWLDGDLTGLARFINGKNFTKGAEGTGRPVLRIKELRGGLSDATVRSEAQPDPEFVADHFDLLFAWSGTLGVHRWDGPQGLVNQHIFKVIPHEGIPLWFVECWLKRHISDFASIARDKATTMGHIQRRDLSEASVLIPTQAALAALHATIGPIDSLRQVKAREASRLREVRRALLPKLLSGELRVSMDYLADVDVPVAV